RSASVCRVADDRTGHAVAAATAAAELGAGNRDDLDAGLPQQRIGVDVAIVGEDDAGRGAYQVGAAVPLGAFAHVVGAGGLHDPHLLQPERVAHGIDERPLVAAQVDGTRLVARTVGIRVDAVDDVRIDKHAVAVGEREHGV